MVEATCSQGTVTADGVAVEGALITSKGDGESQGALFIQGSKARYFTSNATDIEQTITKLNEAINKVSSILSSIGTGMTGSTTAPPPTLASDLSELSAIVTDLETLKGALK